MFDGDLDGVPFLHAGLDDHVRFVFGVGGVGVLCCGVVLRCDGVCLFLYERGKSGDEA